MPAFVGERDLRPFVVDVQLRLIGEIIELAKFAENIVDWRGLSTENITTVIAVTTATRVTTVFHTLDR